MKDKTLKYCKWCGRVCQNNVVGGAYCPTQFKDWKDAAEFEARVVIKAAQLGWWTGMQYNKSRSFFDILKDARIAVEEEMENEMS